jgi:hypothetical protein
MAVTPEKITGRRLEYDEFPKAIEVSINGEAVQMGPDNFAEVLEQIKESLRPGMPVYIEKVKKGHRMLSKPYTVGNVFLSDGTVDDQSKFNMLWGKQHSASAELFGDDLRIYVHENGGSFREGISIPEQWRSDSWNEGTFNRQGHTDTTYGANGTSRVIIGEDLRSVLTEAVTGIEFVQDSVSVNARQFYGIETSSVTRKGDGRRTMRQHDQESKEAGMIDLLSFTIKMIKKATRQLDDDYYKSPRQRAGHKCFDDLIHIQEVCEFSDGKDGLDDMNGYRLEPNDFIVYELGGSRRQIGYLKTNSGFHGRGYFLPAKGMKRVAKLAFDPGFVKQYFPEA